MEFSDNRSIPASSAPKQRQIRNALSIDVEDYFHASVLASNFDQENWEAIPGRVQRNTEWILETLLCTKTKATFFILGWVAKRYPNLVQDISRCGHEIASHGLTHTRVTDQSPSEFRADIRESKTILEDICQLPIVGYRAASFSIGRQMKWAFNTLKEEGYVYSSSIHPIRHDHYGDPTAPRFPFYVNEILEIPISTTRILGQNIPCGGGGYFRLFPYALTKWALSRINQRENRPCLFYFHPWEIDPRQPILDNIGRITRFRHYVNLNRAGSRLEMLLGDFAWDRIDEVFLASKEYLY